MPYKDKEAKAKALKAWRAKSEVPIEVPPQNEVPTPIVRSLDEVPVKSQAWQHVRDFISTPCPGMDRLERLQRIAGSLGKNAKHVWFGDLTVADIGAVIGTREPIIQRGEG